MKNEYPILYEKKDDCCGCTACYAVCKRKAIIMLPDEEGFLYPRLVTDRCVCCYKCLYVCPVRHSREEIKVEGKN